MWWTVWLAFAVVFVAGPLLYARRLETRPSREVGRLPNPRGRRRPAPDVAEDADLTAARLRLVAASAAAVAVLWLLVAVTR